MIVRKKSIICDENRKKQKKQKKTKKRASWAKEERQGIVKREQHRVILTDGGKVNI